MITATVKLVRAFQKAYARKWSFLVVFLLVFFVSFSTLVTLDLVPDAPKPAVDTTPKVTLSAAAIEAAKPAPEEPIKLDIPSIKLSTNIENPTTTDIDALDAELLKGAVRYPTSAELGQNGNVILFGHSSYLPVVHNQAYKLFDGIQNLHVGDEIMVTSETAQYVYKVETVTKEDANSAAIPLSVGEPTLTLSTCDSFATKSDRFIVVATLVGSHPNGS